MATPRFRAWRFVHPGFDVADGLRPSPMGGIDMVDDLASVRQSILLLLFTSPGERVMRADYGCDLVQLVSMPTNETTLGLAIYYVRKALERWEPRIEILHLDAEFNDRDPSRMDIVLEYRVRGTPPVDRLTVPFNLS